MGDTEDHRLGRTVLVTLLVNIEPHGEVLDVLHLVLGDEPGAGRAEGVGRLALGPLALALGLLLMGSQIENPRRSVLPGNKVGGLFGKLSKWYRGEF